MKTSVTTMRGLFLRNDEVALFSENVGGGETLLLSLLRLARRCFDSGWKWKCEGMPSVSFSSSLFSLSCKREWNEVWEITYCFIYIYIYVFDEYLITRDILFEFLWKERFYLEKWSHVTRVGGFEDRKQLCARNILSLVRDRLYTFDYSNWEIRRK